MCQFLTIFFLPFAPVIIDNSYFPEFLCQLAICSIVSEFFVRMKMLMSVSVFTLDEDCRRNTEKLAKPCPANRTYSKTTPRTHSKVRNSFVSILVSAVSQD